MVGGIFTSSFEETHYLIILEWLCALNTLMLYCNLKRKKKLSISIPVYPGYIGESFISS